MSENRPDPALVDPALVDPALVAAVDAEMPRTRSDLADLVAFPSVHDEDPAACAEACAHVVRLLSELPIPGLGPDSVRAQQTSDGSRTVLAHRSAAPGRPTVLLYSHYDVQPAGEAADWTSPPWELTERDGRWYGRGAADCKGNLAVHLTALRALAAAAPAGADPLDGLGLRLVVEGSEETGGGGLDDLVAERPELVAADAILVVDSGNAATGVPTLTTSLRGIANVVVTVRTLRAGVHSGQYGGAAPDALAALVAMLASLRDPETGATTIDGLTGDDALPGGGHWPGAPYHEDAFRADAGVLDGVEISTAAPVADLVWARPTATVLGIDCPPVEGAIAAVQPSARALVNLRVPPGVDPVRAQQLLAEHLERRRPWNAQLTVDEQAVGYPFATPTDGPVHALLERCLGAAYGVDAVASTGSGGSIPLCTALHEAHPDAQIALFGVEDPAAAIHSPDESVDPEEIRRIALAEAAFLRAHR